MTTREYILLKMMEECAEIQQAISKVLRFGPDSKSHAGEGTNLEHLSTEIVDLCAALGLAMEHGIIPPDAYQADKARIKMEKIEKYLEVSRGLGTVTD